MVKTNLFVLAIRLQDVFKTFSRCPAKTSSRRFQDVFRMSSRRLTKTSWRHLQDVFKTSCKDIFKMVSRRIIKLNCSCQQVFEKYCKDGYLQKDLPRPHFWEIYGQSRKFARVIKICQFLVYYFTTPVSTTPFSDVLTEAYLESGRTSTMESFCGNNKQL